MSKYKGILLLAVITAYSLIYIATSYQKEPVCDSDCDKLGDVANRLYNNRTYVYNVNRCNPGRVSDTICVFVADSSGVNWNLLADSACYFATQVGLSQQKIFVIKNTLVPWDTVAIKQCP